MESKAMKAVEFALLRARTQYQRGTLDQYECGYAHGQLLVAYCDLCAPKYLVDGASNEILFLYDCARKKARAAK